MGKHKSENGGSYIFKNIHDIEGPKSDEVKIKHNHVLIYQPNGLSLHIRVHWDLTTKHFAIPVDVYEYFFKDETPSRDKKWACYNKSLDMNIKESTYKAYRYECIKPKNIIKNEPYEVRQVNFYKKAATTK